MGAISERHGRSPLHARLLAWGAPLLAACLTLTIGARAFAQAPRSRGPSQSPEEASTALERLADRHLRLARALESSGDTRAALNELRMAYALRAHPARALLQRAQRSVGALHARLREAATPNDDAARERRAALCRAVERVEKALARAYRRLDGEADASVSRSASEGESFDIPIVSEVLVPVAWRADFKSSRTWATYPVTELIVPDDWNAWAPHGPSRPDGSLLVPRGW